MKVIHHLFKWLKGNPAFVILVLVPFLAGALYLSVIATDRYVSEAKLVVKKSGISNEGSQLGLASILTGNISQNEDVNYLKEYLQSADVLEILDKKIGLREIYADPNIDFVHRMPLDASQEVFLEHFRSMTKVELDESTSILSVNVQAFRPADAQRINRLMMDLAEIYVNKLSHQVAEEQTSYIEKEIVNAKSRLDGAKERLIDFQNKHGLLNPVKQAETATAVTTEMQAEIAKLDAELKNMLAYMNPEAPQVIAMRHRLSALRAQIAEEKTRITGLSANKDEAVLNELASQYEMLQYELEFATQVYRSTLTAMEQLRVEIAQKIKNVILITQPQLPQDPTYPQVLRSSLTLGLILLFLYGALRLIVATIKDHQD